MGESLSHGSYLPSKASRCVEWARARAAQAFDTSGEVDYRAVEFGVCSGLSSHGWWLLYDGNACCGVISFCMIRSQADPVKSYICIRLSSGEFLEYVECKDNPGVTVLYSQGVSFGSIVEDKLTPDRVWWKRWFCGQRQWRLRLGEDEVATVPLQYPLGTWAGRTSLSMFLSNGSTLPVDLSRAESRFVIPPRTPGIEREVERLHFVFVVFVRVMIASEFE